MTITDSGTSIWTRLCCRLHSGQTHDACTVPAIILQKKRQTKVESFTLTAKLNAISENLSNLLQAYVQNEVTGIHKFYRREIFFIGIFCASFSYERRARKSLASHAVVFRGVGLPSSPQGNTTPLKTTAWEASKSLNWFKLQGSEKPEVTLFLRLTAVKLQTVHLIPEGDQTSYQLYCCDTSQRSNVRRVRSSCHT